MALAKFLFLGTGGSLGIPIIGCHCPVCTSSSPKNRRLRPSGLLKVEGKQFLLDAGPDVRTQLLRAGIERLDGVLFTHAHFDHLYGIDDLRVFYFLQKKSLPCLLSKETFAVIEKRFHYLLLPKKDGTIQLTFQLLQEELGRCSFEGLPFDYCSFAQAGMKVTGYRLGDFAYVCDIRDYGSEVFTALDGVSVLVLSALRPAGSPMHFSLDEAVAFAGKVGAKNTYLTHMTHDVDHETVNASLPSAVQLAYDGLEIDIFYGT